MALSPLTILMVGHYMGVYVHLVNAGQTHEMYNRLHAAEWAVAGVWAELLAVVFVMFGRGWGRVLAVCLGLVLATGIAGTM
jgi:hypothetical protein